MKFFKSFFLFSNEHRRGIFLLFGVILILQLCIYYFDSPFLFSENKEVYSNEKWLSMQLEIDSIKTSYQANEIKIYPFNPNYISDYKGYNLGMSVEEIDKLHQYRSKGKFVNSKLEFQKVTGVSDDLLNKIAPYFKFPDWVSNTKKSNNFSSTFKKNTLIDINSATKEDLMAVKGIGDKISEIIIKERTQLGAFATLEQLKTLWGISPSVYNQLQKHFKVGENPSVIKIKINQVSQKELSRLPFFNYYSAKEVVAYRTKNGKIKNFEDLIKIKGFSVENSKIIALYLDFD